MENSHSVISTIDGNNRKLFYVLVCINVLIQWVNVETSICTISTIVHRFLLNNLSCICIIALLNITVSILINRINIALLISDILTMALAIGNHYTYIYHGSPLRISEIRSLNTAINVIKGYDISIDYNAFIAMGLFTVELATVILLGKLFEDSFKITNRKTSIAGVIFCLLILIIVFGTENHLNPKIGWSWSEAANQYGYSACLIEDTIAFNSKIDKPEEYDYVDLEELYENEYNDSRSTKDTVDNNGLPDIILILNESFYDPTAAIDLKLKTDVQYLYNYNSQKSAIKGLAAVPYTGTNSSEYELLTSNSMSIINPSAPFNFFSMTNANSIVSYLKKLGYETWAMHDAVAENYSRNIAYPEMGFDHVVFRKYFEPIEQYGNRYVTDSSDYRKMEGAYESSGDNPRFIYLLTLQNHGGYEQNEAKYDKVHCINDYGDSTDDMNEFLTSIQMSDSALKELIDYFSTVNRKVIVAMVGDHPPSFVTDGSIPYDNIDDLNALKRKMTPYFMWSNYKDLQYKHEYISLVDLVPMVLKEADLPLSIYYKHLLDIQESIPVRIYDKLIDNDNKLIELSAKDELKTAITQYYCMEYNNCLSEDKRLQKLFEPIS